VNSSAPSSEGGPGRANGRPASPPFAIAIAGVAASGSSDALALRMPGQLLAPANLTLVNL
jgi:hypothetical protein